MGLPDWAQGDWVTWNTPGTNEYELHSSTYYVPTPGTPYYFQISALWAGGTVSSTCTNGQTGKGWTCQSGGGVHTLTTSANGIAPAFHEVRAYPSHGSVMVRAILTNFSMIAQSLVLETGTSNSLGRATNNQATNNESFRTEWSLPEAGLRPSTPYYFRLKAQTGNGTVSSSCSSGETGIGWTCEPGGGKMIFTTAALPANHGEPVPPAPVNTAYPTVNGSTFHGRCRLFGSAGETRGVCSCEYVARARCFHPFFRRLQRHLHPSHEGRTGYLHRPYFGSGFALPPEGTRVTNDYESVMPRLVKPLETHLGWACLGRQMERKVGSWWGYVSDWIPRRLIEKSISPMSPLTALSPPQPLMAFGSEIRSIFPE